MAGAIMSSTGQSWMTPPELVKAVLEVLGTIDLDPCASSGTGTVPAKIKYTGPKAWGGDGRDGLGTPWWGNDIKTVFVNPPYGRNDAHPEILGGSRSTSISDWLAVAAEASLHGVEVICLVPAATETRAWERNVWPTANSICFLRARPRFWQRLADGTLAPAKSCITRSIAAIYWGPNSTKFNEVFKKLGVCILGGNEPRVV